MDEESIERRTYYPEESAVFFKTREKFGHLSNMAAGYPVIVADVEFRTIEALYQSMRYPRNSQVQSEIIAERSPMTAKMKSKKYVSETRQDWTKVRVPLMRWCLRVKLAQNYARFVAALEETSDRPIVEKKIRREDFWGAKVQENGSLVGRNVLGRLLMELREQVRNGEYPPNFTLHTPSVENLFILGRPVNTIHAGESNPTRLL